MKKETAIKIFDTKQVRSAWSEEDEKWYFSVIDVAILTDSPDAKDYWHRMKKREKLSGCGVEKTDAFALLNSYITNCNCFFPCHS
ncbi:hypothetical protein BH11BAC7_BH11BAC7_12270 [soil metagenome]